MEIEGLRIRFLAGNPALAADLSTLFREIEQTSGNATGCRLPSKGTWLRTGVDLGALLDVAVWIKTVLGCAPG
jgi:hypothetical protein